MDLYIYKFLRQILLLVCKKCSQNGGKKKNLQKVSGNRRLYENFLYFCR